MVVRIQLRHDTAQNWTTANPILLSGEVGIETDTDRLKIGTGNRWNDTNYYDKQYVHTQGAEEIYGEKTFRDNLKVGIDDTIEGRANVDIFGNLTVSGEIDGVAYRAYEDGEGNNIIDTYQKKITGNDTVVDGINWNTLVSEGTYGVEINNWNYNEYYDPSGFNTDLGRVGMLIVHEDNDGRIIQRYNPMTANALNTVVVRYRTASGSWSNWTTPNTYDETLVHNTGEEEIDGSKVFKQVIKSENGTINLSVDKDDMDAGQSARLQRAGSTFLRKESNGEVYLSSENANLYIRPNGNNSETGQVVIDTNGVIDGKCLKDGQGRVISSTYVTVDDLQSLSLKEPHIIDRIADPDTYDAIVDRKAANFGTFTDIIKANNYTVQGSLTITDGVATGFTNTDYVTPSIPTSVTTNYLCLKGAFIPVFNSTGVQYVFYKDSNNFFRITSNTIEAKIAGVTYYVADYTLTANEYYSFMIRLNGTQSSLYVTNMEEPLVNSSTISNPITISDIANMIGTDGNNPFQGYIDLNAFRIFVDYEDYEEDVPVYQPCLCIPYTLSKFGVKIVDGVYAERTLDCYNQFRTGNYFILDEENQQFRLPFDSPNGLAHTLYSWRNGSAHCEYDTNLECIQMSGCTNGTAITFKKPFADNNYSLVGVTYSAKTATGFTPTADGWYIARGRITLDNNIN